jgi:hypothetical protein
MIKLQGSSNALKMALANELLPTLNDITNAMLRAKAEGGLLAGILAGISAAAGSIAVGGALTQAEISKAIGVGLGALVGGNALSWAYSFDATVISGAQIAGTGSGSRLAVATPTRQDGSVQQTTVKVTLTYADGSTGTHAMANPDICAVNAGPPYPAGITVAGPGPHNVTVAPEVNLNPDDTSDAIPFCKDWKWFRDRMNPGVIPGIPGLPAWSE